jgi:hypothetical protein|eukprot:evm.model.NODE_20879_length_20762_cov_47.043877.2
MSDALSDDGEGSATASASTNSVTRCADLEEAKGLEGGDDAIDDGPDDDEGDLVDEEEETAAL